MVNYIPQSLDTVFSALSDATRRAILVRLSRGEATVSELAAPFAMSLPAISKHLHILETAGLVIREKEGRIHHMRLAPGPLQSAADWLDYYRQYWDAQFDSLASFLETEPDADKDPLDGDT